MVVERFSQSVINSGVFRLYIATGFFATLIFFVVNADLFTPLEMIFGIIGVTIVLKGVSNMMLSLIILLFNLDAKREELNFKYNDEKINAMMAELGVQDAQNVGKKTN
jgi:polyferredoxin